MRKVILLSFVSLIMFQVSQAQCPVAPRYLNASNATDSGFLFIWNQLKPSCDSVFGFELGIKPTGGKWAYYGLDSLSETDESDWPFSLILGPNTFTVGTKYAWKMRTWTDKGGISYSAWVTGTPFTIADPVASGNCMPPSSACLFTPGSTTVTCIWDGTSGPWNAPTKYQFETKASGGAWVSTVAKIAGGINATGLTASTDYDWRLRFKCGTQSSSWLNGPAFNTTAAGISGKDVTAVAGTVKGLQRLDEKNIRHEADEVVATANTLLLYPNPAKSILHVQMTTADDKSIATYGVILKDLSGRIFYSATSLSAASLKNLSVDVSRMPTGFYMLEIRGSDNSITTSKVNISRE